jgi:hypothetical protein
MSEHASTETALEGDGTRDRSTTEETTAARDNATENAGREGQNPNLVPSGTDATGGASDTTTDYAGGKIQGG